MSQPRRKATYDDLLRVPGEVRAEPFDAVAVDLARRWGEA